MRVDHAGADADPECGEVERVRSAAGARSRCGKPVASLVVKVASACAEAEALCQPPTPCCVDRARDAAPTEGAY